MVQPTVGGFLRARARLSGLVLLAALALAWCAAPTAQAVPVADELVSFEWLEVRLTTDYDGDGVIDPGDRILMWAEVTLDASAPAKIGAIAMSGGGHFLRATVEIVPGETEIVGFGWTTKTSDFDVFGNFRSAPDLMFGYTIDGEAEAQLDVPEPSVILMSEGLDVVTVVETEEAGGYVEGQLVEGDRARLVTTVTNVSEVPIDLTGGTGFATPLAGLSLAAGESATLNGEWQDVSYADMEAGSLALSAATLEWTAPAIGDAQAVSGTVDVASASVPLEALSQSFDAGVEVVVHDPVTGGEVADGAADVGDIIDFSYSLTNTGTVVLGAFAYSADAVASPTLTQVSDADIAPGASLPAGAVEASQLTTQGGVLDPYVITESDLARGSVDLVFYVGAARDTATLSAQFPGGGTDLVRVERTVELRPLITGVDASIEAELEDGNGDGIGQAGERVLFTVTVTNRGDSDQPVSLAALVDSASSDVALAADVGLPDTLAPGESHVVTVARTLSADDQARGSVTWAASTAYVGEFDGEGGVATASVSVPTGTYVAPESLLAVSLGVDDVNGDGSPSIGEPVSVSVTVTNDGAYPLTGVEVADSASSDVVSTLPAFPAQIEPGESVTRTFTYVLTSADFARGSVSFAFSLDAEGLATPLEASAATDAMTFASDELDLVVEAEGQVSLCDDDGAAVSVAQAGQTIAVVPGACGYAGDASGYRVMIYSTPTLLGTGTFVVTLPQDIAAGVHRVALYAPDGSLVGWQALAVEEASETVALAATGSEEGALMAALLAAVGLSAAGVAALRTRGRLSGQ